ncbi:uncharacterized protein LOC132601952 [Lycium barbarum]|uniref:uncharacterized protein LOC132601952 n=1 Tax=Lycium barbarum TaxID=112863 RepID=UPI00293E4B0F|nr:uncharacterized protein LOC132601952 [Lycium barbarum]
MDSKVVEQASITDEIFQASIKDEIFQASLKKKWVQFQHLYTNYQFLHKYRFNRFEDTALHIAISSYHPDRDDPKHQPHLTCIKAMIANIPEENRSLILKQQDYRGNTPLHLAAALGFVPIIECLVKPEDPALIWVTNSKGETPLFVTAYRGKLQAFLYLHKCVQYENGEGPTELCRRNDGENILHAAIFGEFFDVAFQIIHYYPLLVNYYNTVGVSPLHILSGMPQVFRRGRFRLLHSIIHFCINIDELELMTYKPGDSKSKFPWNLPGNYQTVVEFLELLQYGTRKILDYIKEIYFGNRKDKSEDTAQATNVNPEESPDHQSYCQSDPENPPIKDTTNVNQDKMSQAEGKRNGKWFPANYTIFIEFLKCVMKIVLFVLAIGLPRIKKTEERKRQHARGVQIMKLLIKKDERYKFYERTGEEPKDWGFHFHNVFRDLSPPTKPPLIVEDDNKKDEDQSKTAATELSKETPLLVASRMGIVEMVKNIIMNFPISIQDTDSEGKNALLLAAEHRQADVYNCLIRAKFPECVFYQVDKNGNNAVHLAAKFQKVEVWGLPGSALQLQGERKWYKYVKQTLPPQLYVNHKGRTPREIFIETHADLRKDGREWLLKTAKSYSVVATLFTTVAFATAATIPGGPDEFGHPRFQNQPAFNVFCISSLVSLCFSVMALVFFLAILTSQFEHRDFEKDLPTKLLIALTSLFASISAILVSFCAAHFFVLGDKFKNAALPIYGVTCIPVVFFAFNQFPLYVNLIRSSQKVPIRSCERFKFYVYSLVASSSDQERR